MGLAQITILILLIGMYLKFTKTKEKEDYNKYCDRTINYDKEYNRTVLKTLGKDAYIQKYGIDEYNSIVDNTDTRAYK